MQPSYAWLAFPGSLADRNWPCPAKLSATYLSYLFLFHLSPNWPICFSKGPQTRKGQRNRPPRHVPLCTSLPFPFLSLPDLCNSKVSCQTPSSGPLRSQDGHFLLAITAFGELCLLESRDTCPSICKSRDYLEPSPNTGSGPAPACRGLEVYPESVCTPPMRLDVGLHQRQLCDSKWRVKDRRMEVQLEAVCTLRWTHQVCIPSKGKSAWRAS